MEEPLVPLAPWGTQVVLPPVQPIPEVSLRDYTLTSGAPLGDGAQGFVQLGKDQFGREVALKFIKLPSRNQVCVC
jgi:hypothetical protein